MLTKLDAKTQFKALYAPTAKAFSIVQVPALNFLMIDGQGDPNTAEEYKQAVEALYSLSYTLKFSIKKAGQIDYAVMPLEGLWWSNDMENFMGGGNRDQWQWTMLIMQPEPVTAALFAAALKDTQQKKPSPALDKVRFERFEEGHAAQIMYLGAYKDEGPTIARLHEFIAANGYALAGKHHEIYLSDPRRTAPEKLKTVIRQPMQAKRG